MREKNATGLAIKTFVNMPNKQYFRHELLRTPHQLRGRSDAAKKGKSIICAFANPRKAVSQFMQGT